MIKNYFWFRRKRFAFRWRIIWKYSVDDSCRRHGLSRRCLAFSQRIYWSASSNDGKLQRHAQALRNGKKPSKELMKSMQSRLRACFPEATILPFKQQACIAKTIRKQRFTSSIRFQPGPRWNLSSTSWKNQSMPVWILTKSAQNQCLQRKNAPELCAWIAR